MTAPADEAVKLQRQLPDGSLTISIPKMLIGEHSATAIALVVHELATNSMKYGALSAPTGKVVISGLDQGEEVKSTGKKRVARPLLHRRELLASAVGL